MKRDEFLEAERERVLKRTTMTVACADLLRWLGGLSCHSRRGRDRGEGLVGRSETGTHIRDFSASSLRVRPAHTGDYLWAGPA